MSRWFDLSLASSLCCCFLGSVLYIDGMDVCDEYLVLRAVHAWGARAAITGHLVCVSVQYTPIMKSF